MDHSKAGVDLMLNVDEKLPASSPDSKPFDRRVVQSALCLMLQDDGDVCTIHEALIACGAAMHRSKADDDRVLAAVMKMHVEIRDSKPFEHSVHM